MDIKEIRSGCEITVGLSASEAINLKSAGEPHSDRHKQTDEVSDTHPEELCSVRRHLQRGDK